MPKNSRQCLCTSGWGRNSPGPDACRVQPLSFLPLSSPLYLTSPDVAACLAVLLKGALRLDVGQYFSHVSKMLYSWLGLYAWVCDFSRVTLMSCRCWHVYIHSLSVCPLCCTVQCLSLFSCTSLWMKQAWRWHSPHHRAIISHSSAPLHSWKSTDCRLNGRAIDQTEHRPKEYFIDAVQEGYFPFSV